MHSILRQLLNEVGIRDVQDAYNGYEAIEALSNGENYRPDVIICDLHMEKMDGMEFANQLRRRKDMTPILMLTGETNDLVLDVSLQVGVNKILKKPISAKALYAEICEAVGFEP